MIKDTKNQYINKLKDAGYKITKPRLLVLSFLMSSKKPVSVKAIIKNVKGKLDQVTVYRILEMLKKDNIVSQIDLQDDSAYFELKDNKKDHHHIICTECKKIKDFTGCESVKLSNKALQQVPEFSKINSHSFEFFGICKSCSN